MVLLDYGHLLSGAQGRFIKSAIADVFGEYIARIEQVIERDDDESNPQHFVLYPKLMRRDMPHLTKTAPRCDRFSRHGIGHELESDINAHIL